jgi:plasmid rolling circle replication initiator protein Rep
VISIGGKLKICDSLNSINRNTEAIKKTNAILELGLGMTAISRKLEILRSFNEISRNTDAMKKAKPMFELLQDGAVISRKLKMYRPLDRISRNTLAIIGIVEIKFRLYISRRTKSNAEEMSRAKQERVVISI